MNVYDASALMAYLKREPGWENVRAMLATEDGVMSVVNVAEVLSKLAIEDGIDPAWLLSVLRRHRLIGEMIMVEPFLEMDAVRVAELRPRTRSTGASLGDRTCLALTQRLAATVVTSDRPWTKLRLGIAVRKFRP